MAGEEIHEESKLHLELGDIVLGVDQALTLRSGMNIKCELPESFEAKLKYNGFEIADVEVLIEGRNMNLKVVAA